MAQPDVALAKPDVVLALLQLDVVLVQSDVALAQPDKCLAQLDIWWWPIDFSVIKSSFDLDFGTLDVGLWTRLDNYK